MVFLQRLRSVDRKLTRTPGHYILAALAIAAITAVLEVPVYVADRIYYNPLTTGSEFVATLCVASIFIFLTGSFVASLLIVQGLVVSNYLKFFFLREGLIPSDFANVQEAMVGAGPVFATASIVAVAAIVGVAALFFSFTHVKTRALGLAAWAAVFGGAYLFPREVRAALQFDDYERFWQVSSEFQTKGFFRSFASAAVDLRRLSLDMEAFPLLASLPAGDLRTLGVERIARKPDIHIVLLESFINPEDFTAVTYNVRPVPQAIGSLIATGESRSYSPVIGGKTAKAEFEVLCGVPDFDLLGTVTFNQMGTGPVDCLPRLLARAGYHTMASTPLPGSFFNIKQAYKAVGFHERLLKESFAFDDKDGSYLNNASALRQNMAVLQKRLAAAPERPLFNYVVLLGGHFPFARDEARRPTRIQPSLDLPVLRDMVNMNYYTLIALEDYLEGLERLGRDSTVVLFGDHIPPVPDKVLESAGYRGFDPARPVTARRTFLLVLRNGKPVPLGNVAQFEIPHAVVQGLLGKCGEGVCAPADPILLRQPGVYSRAEPGEELCKDREDGATCATSARKLEAMRDVYQHLVKQSYLPEIEAGAPGMPMSGPAHVSEARVPRP